MGQFMTGKRTSSKDWIWRFFEVLRDEDHIFSRGLTAAVVFDTDLGWRAVTKGRAGKRLDDSAPRRFLAIETDDLQARFALKKSR